MKYVLLPRTELSVSRLCFGCWGIISDQHWGQRDARAALSAIRAALDSGINFFDTAAMYGNGESERLLGRALTGRRSEVIIASKLAGNRMRPAEIPGACEQSLRDLNTDYLDLLQTHWTSRDVPLSDTWEAISRLQEQGKIRYAGVCNAGLGDLHSIATPRPPVTDQLPYSLLWRMIEAEILPCCRAENIGVLAYSPLMHGLLAGKYRTADEVPEGRARSRHFGSHRPLTRHGEPGCEAETFAALDRVRVICEEIGSDMADVALAWCLQQPGVACVIVGAASEQHVQRNVSTLEAPLAEQVVEWLNDATRPLLEALGSNPDLWQGSADSRFR
jgi:aryl-alcohol dehydrogenase-like predicted oxidoreductase